MRMTPSDIIGLLPVDGRYNLHSHTQFCDGRHSMERILQSAIDEGMTLFGFSPHSPVPVDSPCNMSRADVALYLAEIERLRTLYGDKITILSSMEIDYLGEQWGPSSDFFSSIPLDYTIGSVHFIPAIDGTLTDIDGSSERFLNNMSTRFNNDIDYVINSFFDATESMIEAGGFEIIGHFDKILLNATAYDPDIPAGQLYRRRVDRIIECISSAGIIAEINTKHRDTRGHFFPHEDLWGRLLRAGVPLVVNSDVHYAELVNAGRDKALNLLHTKSLPNT